MFCWNLTTSQTSIVTDKFENEFNLVIHIELIVYTSCDYTTWINSYQMFHSL